jgi:hypothetical protein
MSAAFNRMGMEGACDGCFDAGDSMVLSSIRHGPGAMVSPYITIGSLGPGHLGAIVPLATDAPQRTPGFYRAALPPCRGLSHVTFEINRTAGET